jgi:hypothetical protein
MAEIRSPFSNLQMELLKLFSTNLSDKDLRELKDQLAQFYAQKSISLADQVWMEKNLTNEDMDGWLNENRG